MKACFRELQGFWEWPIDCEFWGYHRGAAEDLSLVMESDALPLAKQVAVSPMTRHDFPEILKLQLRDCHILTMRRHFIFSEQYATMFNP